MMRLIIVAAIALLIAAPAFAQQHDHRGPPQHQGQDRDHRGSGGDRDHRDHDWDRGGGGWDRGGGDFRWRCFDPGFRLTHLFMCGL